MPDSAPTVCSRCRQGEGCKCPKRKTLRHEYSYLYGQQWQKFRKNYLIEHPLCAECLRNNKTKAATIVDHIVPHRGCKKLFWCSINGYQSLCTICHNIKTSKGE